MTDEAVREIHRARWQRSREAERLLDPGADDFARGGLGQHVPNLSARLLILPGDPEVSRIEFDQSLWEWWKKAPEGAFAEPRTDWGNAFLPTSAAAVRCVSLFEDKWDSYLALPRHGGFDMGLGAEGATERESGRIFCLVRIVGRIWAALHLYREVVVRFGLTGPWECAVALVKTRGGSLGNFGDRMGRVSRPEGESPCLPGAESAFKARSARVARP